MTSRSLGQCADPDRDPTLTETLARLSGDTLARNSVASPESFADVNA
jgi:hypothetical protein